jgi:hypothetical protein
MNKYYKLAQLIKLCAREITKDDIAKTLNIHTILGIHDDEPVLEVTDDSGHRNILIGDVYTDNGYCYVYVDNTDKKGNFRYKCFPPIIAIAKRLQAIAEKDTFYVEGNADYTDDVGAHDGTNCVMKSKWMHLKRHQKSVDYFAKTVEMFADKVAKDPRSAKEIVATNK